MGRLTEDMTNLRDEIDTLRNGRAEFIAGLKHGMSALKSDVVDMRRGFREDHTQMAENMKDHLKAFMSESEGYVSNLKNDATEIQKNFRNDHAEMARKLKDDLNVFASGVTSSVADFLDFYRNDHADMAGNMKEKLKAFMAETEAYVSNLKNDASDMQKNFRSDRADMADTLKENLRMFVTGIKSTVSDLENQFRNEHIEMTGKARAERNLFIFNIKQSLADLKLKTTDLLQEIADDLAGSRRAWSGVTPPPAGKKAAEKIPEPTGIQSVEPETTAYSAEDHAKPEKVTLPVNDQEVQADAEKAPLKVRQPAKDPEEQDDLTQINGIGHTMRKRLNHAGIFTFSKLASSTIEELRNALGESGRLANLEMWIKQARELSS